MARFSVLVLAAACGCGQAAFQAAPGTSSAHGARSAIVMQEYRLNNYVLPGPITPLQNQALIKLSKAADRTGGGLFVATEEVEKPREGIVVAAGPGKKHPETNMLLECPVKEGDLVLLAEFSGERVDYCGDSHLFIDGTEVLGVFEGGVVSADAFRPVRDRLLVEMAEQATETASGIALAVQEDEDSPQGLVVQVGSGRLSSTAEAQPMSVSAGDHVLFGKYKGSDCTLEGKKYKVVNEIDCLAKW